LFGDHDGLVTVFVDRRLDVTDHNYTINEGNQI
jgi:hypothetical protein